ncbi:AfsR/SARP family transcriptional regulator [Streptomyces iconiensis]|uniref:BTAD domain-containing putative transcriptional regulator n=1 Tax=Streptomyces iconiensis TaxID=1384038 RepID=A0ABT6ZPX4_9ACTN|nr:BTAD domain-containing putative transcriptional regulator [Streptomyces iconiensis]MDJ1131102.1 BTAD domain-containing putative transcriptional regulator [Streptomyces iconiensis]
MSRLRITLLGPLEVAGDQGELYVPQGRARALLAVLALRPGRTVPTAQIVTALWDGEPPASAHAGLSAYAARLNAALDPRGTGRRLVQETEDGYVLSGRDVEVDADTFRWLLAQAAGAREQDAERGLLDRALELWRGAPLSGVDSGALHRTVVPSLHEERLRAAHRRLDLDLRPGPPAPVRTAPPGCQLPPPADPLGGRPGGPPDGGGTLDEALDTLFATGQGTARRDIVVLHGASGTGKTALALRWARRARPLFPDGTFFVDLCGQGPGAALPSTVTGTLLGALGLGQEHLPLGAGARRSLLRTACAGRRLLLVLDDAASAAQVRCVLPGPGTRVLVTSRRPLHGLPGGASAQLHLHGPAGAATFAVPGGCRTRHAPLA